MTSNYSKLTPKIDLGKKQPKKAKVGKLLTICKEHNMPVRNIMNPGFASIYQTEFIEAFRKICRIYAESEFRHPELQVLILMLDNNIHPCRADEFNRQIVLRLAGSNFLT